MYMKIAKRVDLKCSYHKKEMVIILMMEVLANATMVIISQQANQINMLYTLNLYNVLSQ